MRLTKRHRELIPQTRYSISKGTISYISEDDVGGQAKLQGEQRWGYEGTEVGWL